MHQFCLTSQFCVHRILQPVLNLRMGPTPFSPPKDTTPIDFHPPWKFTYSVGNRTCELGYGSLPHNTVPASLINRNKLIIWNVTNRWGGGEYSSYSTGNTQHIWIKISNNFKEIIFLEQSQHSCQVHLLYTKILVLWRLTWAKVVHIPRGPQCIC